MAEKPMTPHERAKQVITAWKRGDGCGEPGLVTMVTTALQAQSNADEVRHREKRQALRDLLAQQAKRADDLDTALGCARCDLIQARDERDSAQKRADETEAEIKRRDATCARCDSKGPKAEGTIWCAECLEWYREEWAQHSPCAKEAVLAEELAAKEREIRLLTDKLIAAGNAKADANDEAERLRGILARAIPSLRHHEDDREVCYQSCVACAADEAMAPSVTITGADSGSVEDEARDKIQQIGYAETLRRVGDCGKWSLTWESVSRILELLQEGIISRRKSHESLNAVLHGMALNLPPLENCAFDDVELPGETVRQLRRSAFELSNNYDMAQGKCDEAIAAMHAAQAQAAELRRALEQVSSAIGDRLLGKGPLSRDYANSLRTQIAAALALSPSDALAAQQKREAEQAALVEQLRRVLEATDKAFERFAEYHGSCCDTHNSTDETVPGECEPCDIDRGARRHGDYAALSLSPGEALARKTNWSPCPTHGCRVPNGECALCDQTALERVRRDATIAALETLPCAYKPKKSKLGDCIAAFRGHADLIGELACPRCKALAEAKGEKQNEI